MTFGHRHIAGVVVAGAMLVGGTMVMYTVSRARWDRHGNDNDVREHDQGDAAVLAPVLAWRRRTRR